MVSHKALELLACILAALIAVVQQAVWPTSPPSRHNERIGDELCRHLGLHRPADDTS